jgi:hypothetical protein
MLRALLSSTVFCGESDPTKLVRSDLGKLTTDVSAQNHKGMLDFLFKFNVLFFFLAVSS